MLSAVFAISGFFSLLSGWILLVILPDVPVFSRAIIFFGVLLIAAAVIMEFRRVKKAVSGARGLFGIGTAANAGVFFGIIILVNILGISFFYRWDFTGSRQFTLAPQTRDFLEKLDTQVEVVTLFSPRVPYTLSAYAQGVLDEYRDKSKYLSIQDIDPDIYPERARRYGLDQTGAAYGAIVIRSGNSQRIVYGPELAAGAEHAITGALMEVTGIRQKKIYFLSGHGEGRIDREFLEAARELRKNMFAVQELDLIASQVIPADAAAMVIADAKGNFTIEELRNIQNFLLDGGSLLLLVNPYPNKDIKNFIGLWGIDIPDGIVVDPSSYAIPNKESILIPRTRNSFRLAQTFFPGAAPIIPQGSLSQALELLPLVWTSRDAWIAEESGQEKKTKTDTALEGPFALGAMISEKPVNNERSKGIRIVVIGDSDFASNENFNNGNNGELFLSVINWLTDGIEIVSMERKVLVSRRILLSPEQARFLNLSSVGLFPLLLLAFAFFVWRRMK